MRLLGRSAAHLQHLCGNFVQITAAHFRAVHRLHVAQAVEEVGPTRKLVKSSHLVPGEEHVAGARAPCPRPGRRRPRGCSQAAGGEPARCAGAPSSEAS